MAFYADLHVHSKYSRATSRNCDLEHLALWARKKGIAIVGTGGLHPTPRGGPRSRIGSCRRSRASFVCAPISSGPSRSGCRPPAGASGPPPGSCCRWRSPPSTRKLEKTRKIHHLIYTPDFEAMDRVTASLARIGNVNSDGRPILGLDSRHLLEIALESDPGSYLVPGAHLDPVVRRPRIEVGLRRDRRVLRGPRRSTSSRSRRASRPTRR